MVYTPRSDDGPLEMSCNFYRVKKRAGYYGDQYKPLSLSVTRYLVESRGKLLMVLRHHSGRRARGTLRFRIFEMKLVIAPDGLSKASWVELDELSGRVLFLGRGCSRAFEVSQLDAVREGSIYYLDDTRFDISTVLDNGRDFSSADMGMNMYKMLKTRSRVRNFPRRFTSESSPPIWYVPELIDAMAFS
uniref:KIB1-4 beta-propeller domain-containing protein n=1 Tax=Arundo donax TaxID=35708 RepID=A0A0A9FFN4_ARUDO